MTATQNYRLDNRFIAESGTVFLTGIQALARLPIDQLRADRRAGLHTAAFVSGYQGSPLGGYGEAVAGATRTAQEAHLVYRPAVNEEYAATAVMGSQLAATRPDCRYDGVVGVWYGKAPGVDRAADALRHAVFAGTAMHGGAVALVGDDPAAKSSTVPSSSAGLLADMHMPLLYPGDPAEALDLGRHAIALSRASGLWSALKIVADVADATASVTLDPDRVEPVIPLIDGQRYQHVPDGRLLTPHTLEIEREILEVRYELARQYAADNRLNHVTVDPPDAWIGIVASGVTYREVREALARLGLSGDDAVRSAGIRLLKMGMPMPFNATTMRNFARGVEQVLVVEEKQPNIESLLKDALYSLPDRPVVVGKQDETGALLLPGYGSLDADILIPILRRRLQDRIGERLVPEVSPESRTLIPLAVQRTPAFCSGCPHNRSTEVPDGSLVGAGIGCHTMTLLMDEDRVGDIAGLTCMGSEGTQWIGMADFVETSHLFQNIGDGTYFHSGQLAVQAAIASGVNITYKLLHNGTVAMTGGQDPQGQLPLDRVCRVLLAQGVARVILTTADPASDTYIDLPGEVEVWDRTRLLQAQQTLARTPGATVLIHDQACAAEARRDRKRGKIPTPSMRVVINPRLCEGCGDCGQVSNCLSVQPVETPFGRKTTIDQTSCNLDYSCLEGDCPSFMTIDTRPPGPLRRLLGRNRVRREPVSSQHPPPCPAPTLVVPTDEFAMRITGIGGTGVVTVAQVIGTAAMLDGFHVRGLDQIGLSQKAGPVVSDVRLSREQPTATSRLGDSQADLLLAFDQLVAASAKGMLTAAQPTTHVVGSTSPTPTGAMITHPDIEMPSAEALAQRLADRSLGDHHWADAQAVTADLFGATTTANLFVVGMAVQAGALPIDPDRIEEAIALNGVAVDANQAAFRWGRLQIHDPDAVANQRQLAHADVAANRDVPDSVADRIAALDLSESDEQHLLHLASELRAWGTTQTVTEWLDHIEQTAAAEHDVDAASDALTMAVARGLFKLTAYKDEYEVARLMLDPAATQEARHLGAEARKVAWRLHPPTLRAMGLGRKLAISTRWAPAMRMLAAAKRLRGTPLDPFGRAEVRRAERSLPAEYTTALNQLFAELTADQLPEVIAVAELAEEVRGYEHIKMANVAEFRAALAAATPVR